MKHPPRDDAREQRIAMEIVVDCYDEVEQAQGWFCYLEENLRFPFQARCIARRAISPLQVGDEIEVVGMAPDEECDHEMFVLTPWERGTLAVPLSQLEALGADPQTQQAIEDWHYWVGQGNEL
jgi:hypothetical protein